MNETQKKNCKAINAVLTQVLQSRHTYVCTTEFKVGAYGEGYYTQVVQLGCGSRDVFFKTLYRAFRWRNIMHKYEKYMGPDEGEDICPDCFHVLAKCICVVHDISKMPLR